MSLRSLFVVSLTESKILYIKEFPTVEVRWRKKHPSTPSLPKGQEMIQALLNELGVVNSTTFQTARDSCQKPLQAPLFWIPYEMNGNLEQNFWPVILVECQSRLLCGVPNLDQLHPKAAEVDPEKKVSSIQCPDLVIILELLSKLVPYIELSTDKMVSQLPNIIQQWLPFGRDSGRRHLEILMKPAAISKGMWRSKPKLDIHIKEEVRMCSSSTSELKTEVYGTIALTAEPEVDFNGRKLQLLFSRLTNLPTLLFHPTVFYQPEANSSSQIAISTNGCLISFQNLPERIFNLCHYSAPLEEPPIQSVLKIRKETSKKSSIFIQLHIISTILRALNRLEVRFLAPPGSRIAQVLTPANHNLGPVSLLKEGCILSWNLTPLILTSSTNNKLKEDMVLNLDVETSGSNPDSFLNSQIVISFTSSTTLTGAQVVLSQPSDLKLIQGSELKSSTYRVSNHQAKNPDLI